MKKEIYIIGIGRNSIVTIDLCESCGYTIKGLYHYNDERTGEIYYGHKIIGSTEEIFSQNLRGLNFAISVGDNTIRSEIFDKITNQNGSIPVLIHRDATFSKYSKIGIGSQIYPGAIVDPAVEIEENCIISNGCIVLHGTHIFRHSFIAPAAVIGANTNIEPYAFIGLNATLISNKVNTVGRNSCIGAGAVVTKSIQDKTIVAGVPAKKHFS